MFADHAAHYFLDIGATTRAHLMAQANYANRQDIGALSLLIETGWQAGEHDVACALLKETRRQGYAPPELESPGRICD